MKICFVGSTEIGFESLKGLNNNSGDICGVISSPEELTLPSGDQVRIVNYRDFEPFCREREIPFYRTTGSIKDAKEFIVRTGTEFMLVIGWHRIIPKEVRELAIRGVAGLHASLLPKYRGGAPLTWALINGETETGITLFYLVAGVDKGDIIAQKRIPISRVDTIKTLYERVNEITPAFVAESLLALENGRLRPAPQDESQATQFPLRSPKDGIIDWSWSSDRIYNWVRAQTKPYPGAFTRVRGVEYRIWSGESTNGKKTDKPGRILDAHNRQLTIQCGNGAYTATKHELGELELKVGDNLLED